MQVGQPVYLKFNPSHRGTVSRVSADGFRVTWVTDGRQAREPRLRAWYSRDALTTGMQLGVPG